MGIGELLLLAVGLSMDAFAVSVCKGLAMKKATIRAQVTCGIWFGGFQGLMPLIGFLLGTMFADAIQSIDHWIAFGLLVLIGINMLREAFSKECDCGCCGEDADLSVKTMFVMAVATSIDALAVGISLAMAGNVNIVLAVALIGVVTFLLSGLGVRIGNIFGSRFEKKAEAAGGIILILLGLKILLEHLGILA
jgi:putative Mn2+ efflux pump MntP